MIIVQEKNNDVLCFDSIKEAESYMEPIDIENGEYINVCNDEGLIYKIQLMEPTKKSRTLLGIKMVYGGSYKIVPTDKHDHQLPQQILKAYAKSTVDKERLEEILNCAGSFEEKLKQINDYKKNLKKQRR